MLKAGWKNGPVLEAVSFKRAGHDLPERVGHFQGVLCGREAPRPRAPALLPAELQHVAPLPRGGVTTRKEAGAQARW